MFYGIFLPLSRPVFTIELYRYLHVYVLYIYITECKTSSDTKFTGLAKQNIGIITLDSGVKCRLHHHHHYGINYLEVSNS